jgi:Ni/Co efflux regulator RcnB
MRKKGQTMKTISKLISAALAASLLAGTAGAAFADPRDHDRDAHREFMREAQRHEWMRGDRFFPERETVVIRDWRGMHLREPGFGAHWVRARGEFLLISNRTGRILDVVIAR